MNETSTNPRVSAVTATAIVIASMVGTGVFTSLGFQVVEIQSGFALIGLWVLGGVLALCGAVSYAELSAAMPRSGGEYHLLGRAFHPCIGFLSGWASATVGFAAPTALAAIAFGKYLAQAVPGLSPMASGVAVIVLTTLVCLMRPKVGGGFLDAFTILKIVLIIVLVGTAFLLAPRQPISFVPRSTDLPVMLGGPFAVSLVYVMYSYAGWNASAYIVNEIRDPARTVPVSLAAGTIVVTLLYVAINAAFLWCTPLDELRGEVEVGVIAARHIFGPSGGRWVAGMITVGLVSTVVALIWSGPRVTQMMGQDYRTLSIFARETSSGVPYVAILWQALLALAMLVTASYEAIMIYIEFVLILSSLLTVAAVVWLRIRRPDLERPYRAWGYPVTPVVYCAFSVFILVHVLRERPGESALGLATLLVGAVLYVLSRRSASAAA